MKIENVYHTMPQRVPCTHTHDIEKATYIVANGLTGHSLTTYNRLGVIARTDEKRRRVAGKGVWDFKV